MTMPPFADWIEAAEDLGTDPAEIEVAIIAQQRLKVAAIVAASVLTAPSEAAILSVFSEISAAANMSAVVLLRRDSVLH